jgi:hypothetical protein
LKKEPKMATITKTRTLRPSSREPSSTYKIDTKKVGSGDLLKIEIYHEDNPDQMIAEFKISGSEVASKNSIHFDAIETANGWDFRWSSAKPNRIR